jgi:signal transduction histidine kinase
MLGGLQVYSISRKLTLMNMMVSTIALLLACASFFIYDLYTFREAVVRGLTIQSQIIGSNTVSAIVFNDPASAEKTLSALQASPHVVYAEIYTPDGHPFAGYRRNGSASAVPVPAIPAGQTQAHWFEKGEIGLVRYIVFQGKTIGEVYIRSDLKAMDDRLKSYLLIVLAVLSICLITALAVSSVAQRAIAKPLVDLAETARVVSREKDYSVRAVSTGKRDEVAIVIEAFNQMLTQIQERDRALQHAHDELETRVQERTAQLRAAHEKLRALSSRLLNLRDEERRHIARELHDGSGQVLAALAMNLSVMQMEAKDWGPRAVEYVNNALDLAQAILRDLRTMSYLLHPPLLEEAGLESALRWFVDGFSGRSAIGVTLDLQPDLGRLPRELEIAIFRLVQECLANIHRHSQSPSAVIRVYRDAERVIVEVQDRGKGMPVENMRSGVGIPGMQERVTQLGGRFDIQSGKDGTMVTAEIPIPQPAEGGDKPASELFS